jgi:hypothetical protein
MQFDSNMTFKDFFNLLNEAGRSRSSGGKRLKPEANDRGGNKGLNPKGEAVGEKGVPNTRGAKGATPDIRTNTAQNKRNEKRLTHGAASKITGKTYVVAKGMDRAMDDEVKIPKELVDQLKQMYPESARFSESIVRSNIGTTLNALFAEHGVLSPSQMYKTIEGGLISEYVDLLIDGYKRIFPESIVKTDKGEYITTLTKNSEHFKYGAPFEEDPKYKKIYNLNTKRLLRNIVIRVTKKGKSPEVQTIHFPEYTTFKQIDIGGVHSPAQQTTAFGQQRSSF